MQKGTILIYKISFFDNVLCSLQILNKTNRKNSCERKFRITFFKDLFVMYSYLPPLNKSHVSWEVLLHCGKLHFQIDQRIHATCEGCQKGSETACEDRSRSPAYLYNKFKHLKKPPMWNRQGWYNEIPAANNLNPIRDRWRVNLQRVVEDPMEVERILLKKSDFWPNIWIPN